MSDQKFHAHLHKQIPVLIFLSLIPGLGYVFLSWLYDLQFRAVVWYILIVIMSAWGVRVYREFKYSVLSTRQLQHWYKKLSFFYHGYFFLWLVIFLMFITEDEHHLHYIAIFTQIGASVVASTLLMPDKKLFRPNIAILIMPLAIYFFLIGEWYGYVLSAFACVFLWVLLYAANSSHRLLLQNYDQANYDFLTGLRNRYNFLSSLQSLFSRVQAAKRYTYVILIDLDHFKTINDSLGHDVGDKLLQDVSVRISQVTPEYNLLARLGGDEFIIAGNEYTNKRQCAEDAHELANKLLNRLKESYTIDIHSLYISASIGVTLVDESNVQNAERLIKEADIAMYEVKKNGRDGVIMFDEELAERVEHNLNLERLLHFSLEKNEIYLQYQPQFDINRQIIGAETLARWQSKEIGIVSPAEFIQIAERTGYIIELGHYIMESAFQKLREWHQQDIEIEQFSINVSMRQFFYYGFVDGVKQLCEQYLTAELRRKIIFEMTESILIEDFYKVTGIMSEIKELGIRFSMDDFGTGYSSLTYLKELPIDEIKIDRSFVYGLDSTVNDQVMIDSILNMARQFKLSVVAEGIEHESQFEFLESRQCDVFQGFYLSRPLSSDDFVALYQQGKH